MATQLLLLTFLALSILGVSTDNIIHIKGRVVEIGGLKSYVSGSTRSHRAVILISDVFGYETPHLRIADKVASAGFYSVVPDFFKGDPIIGQNTTEWIKRHSPEEGYKIAKPVIAAIKRKGITKFGAAGFCWGALPAIDLLNLGQVKSAVLIHPTSVTDSDIKKVRSPIAILGGEKDTMTTPEVILQFGDILKTKPEVDSFVKIFPNAPHGWTLIYNDSDKEAVRRAEEAHNDMLKWFLKYLR